MDFDDEDDYEPSATPKLSLSKLPNRQIRATFIMPTPPNKTLASVPFQWEEAPGKPRRTANTSPSTQNSTGSTTAARRLDLPPRLLVLTNNTTTTTDSSNKFSASFYSPTTVLDGPDRGQSFSRSSSISVRKESLGCLEEEIIREANYHHHRGITNGKRDGVINKQERSFNFTSGGLGSSKERNWSFASESFGFSSSASFTSNSHKSTTSKLPRFKRRSSFASLSQASSNFLVR